MWSFSIGSLLLFKQAIFYSSNRIKLEKPNCSFWDETVYVPSWSPLLLSGCSSIRDVLLILLKYCNIQLLKTVCFSLSSRTWFLEKPNYSFSDCSTTLPFPSLTVPRYQTSYAFCLADCYRRVQAKLAQLSPVSCNRDLSDGGEGGTGGRRGTVQKCISRFLVARWKRTDNLGRHYQAKSL